MPLSIIQMSPFPENQAAINKYLSSVHIFLRGLNISNL